MRQAFCSFTEYSLYHSSLRITQAYNVSVILSVPLAAEHTFSHGCALPSLVLPSYDVFLLLTDCY